MMQWLSVHVETLLQLVLVKEELKVEICSKCHPFFTGKQKIVDIGGRVDKFMKKFNLNK